MTLATMPSSVLAAYPSVTLAIRGISKTWSHLVPFFSLTRSIGTRGSGLILL